MPCDVVPTPCSVLMVSSCTPSQEMIPCLPKKKGAGPGKLLPGALYANWVLAQPLPNPVEKLQARSA